MVSSGSDDGLWVASGARAAAHRCRFSRNLGSGVAASGRGSLAEATSCEIALGLGAGLFASFGAKAAIGDCRVASRRGMRSRDGGQAG